MGRPQALEAPMKGLRTCAECVRLSHPISCAIEAIAGGRLDANP